MIFELEYSTIGEFGEVIMGMSPKGDTYNENEEGLPLLNGPTEFGNSHPTPTLYTTDSKRESMIGDLIFCVRGSTTGRMNWSNQIYSLGRGVCAIRGKTKTDTKYLKYVLDVKLNSLLNVATGGTFPNLKKDDISGFKIPLLKGREKLVSVISAYDNLIENNLKRIKLLEQAAQNIYKEWFVNMRFPGYENTPVDQETGLPEGWKEKELGNLVNFLGGFAFKSKTYVNNGKFRVITIKNVGNKIFDTSVGNYIDKIPTKLKEHCFISEGDILLSLTGNVGRSCIAYGKNNLLNQRVAKIRPVNNNWFPYVYWMFNDRKIFSLMNTLATGSAQQNLSPVKLAKENIVVPSESIINLYCEKVNSFFNQIILLNKSNQKLKSARDILLPRLMNQTIKV